jgi:putative membrane protein
MKKTYAAVATLATTMFLSQGAIAQDQSDQPKRSADTSSQADQSDSSARQAGARPGQSARAGKSQNMDQKFVECAATMDQFEIQAAKLAERQAQDDQIKQFARQIVQDHQQSSQALQQAAQQAGVHVSQQLKPVQQAMLQDLQQMQGEDFDRAWLYGNVAGHTIAVLKYRDAAKECQNEQLKQFAQQTLPKLQQHLQHAQELAQFETAQQAGATERASDRPGTDRSRSGTSDTPGRDTQNRRGAGTSDSGTGATSDSGTGARSQNR